MHNRFIGMNQIICSPCVSVKTKIIKGEKQQTSIPMSLRISFLPSSITAEEYRVVTGVGILSDPDSSSVYR